MGLLKRYKVNDYNDLVLAIRAGQISDGIVELGDGTRALVLIEGGGHNSLGGCRGEFFVLQPEGVETKTVSIPRTEDRSYNWWERARIVYPFDRPLLVEERSERWGEWSPAYFKVRRWWVYPNGRMEEIPLVEEVNETEEVEP
jgi:hypothetical protein